MLTWHHAPGTPPPDRRAAIASALVDLALQPGVRYRAAAGGSAWTERRTTASGASLGDAVYDGSPVTTMAVGGATYVRLPGSTPDSADGPDDPDDPDGTGTGAGSDLAGQWVAGATRDTDSPDAPEAGQSPSVFANLLLKALADSATTLSDEDTAPAAAGGVPALSAHTPQGVVYVSKTRPHRLLAFVPRASDGPATSDSASNGPATGGSASDNPTTGGTASSRTLAAVARSGPRGLLTVTEPAALRTGVDAAAAGAAAFTVAPLSRAESAALAGRIRERVPELRTALDAGVSARVRTEPALRCAASGCVVTSHIAGVTPSAEARRRIRGGRVTVRLTATVRLDGRAAGTCSATGRLSLDAPGDVTCTDAEAGPLFASVEAAKRREAEARARISGAPEPYSVHATADTVVRVLAEVDTSALEQAQRRDEEQLAQAPSPAESAARAASAPSGDRDADRPLDCAHRMPKGAVRSGKGWILNTAGANGRTETGEACLKKPPKNKAAKRKPNPFGYAEAKAAVRRLGLDPRHHLSRCHIIAARFGGSNKLKTNLSPCGQLLTNNSGLGMSHFEIEVAADIAKEPDGSVRYLVEPVFRAPDSSIPRWFSMIAVFYSPTGIPEHVLSRTVPNWVDGGPAGVTNIGN
ncbi:MULTISPECIES: DNA/RNA non-specific endonuclease [unclassified Streptomyces]|uniref:DNA/RNA non-specific endonuclease n=1 Tax=unclassified Streptomyces TaxID=2593676 RepID=UPI0003A0EDBF|nr:MULTISPECIES: DNA/RNA non-specific endonuclease [unclassified Streptomyces]